MSSTNHAEYNHNNHEISVSDDSELSEDDAGDLDESGVGKIKNGFFVDTPIISNVSNALLGISIFASPWGFQQSGVLGGTVVIAIISFLSFCTTSSLLDTQRQLYIKFGEVKSYPEIVQIVLGNSFWSGLVKTATVISCLGGCVGYLIFLGEIASQLFEMDMETVVLVALVPLVLLSWIRSFRELTVFTVLGLGAIFVAILVVFIDGLYEMDVQAAKTTPLFVKRKWMNFLGPATFCFTAHYCVLSVAAEALMEGSSEAEDAAYTSPASASKSGGYRVLMTLPSSSSLSIANHADVGNAENDTPSGPISLLASISGDLKGPLMAGLNSPARATRGPGPYASLSLVLPTSPTPTASPGGYSSAPSSPPPRSLARPLASAYILCSVIFIFHGVSGFIMYRTADYVTDNTGAGVETGCEERVCQNIILNVSDGPMKSVVSVCLCAAILLSYVVLFVPAREHIEGAVLRFLGYGMDDEELISSSGGAFHFTCQSGVMNAVRSALVILTAAIALYVPYFGTVLGRVGGLTDALQAFVIPPLVFFNLGKVVTGTSYISGSIFPPSVNNGAIPGTSSLESESAAIIVKSHPAESTAVDPEAAAACRLRTSAAAVAGGAGQPMMSIQFPDNESPVKYPPPQFLSSFQLTGGVSSGSRSSRLGFVRAQFVLYAIILAWGVFIMSFTVFEMVASTVAHFS